MLHISSSFVVLVGYMIVLSALMGSFEIIVYRSAAKKNPQVAAARLKQHMGMLMCYVVSSIPLGFLATNQAWLEATLTKDTLYRVATVMAPSYAVLAILASGIVMWYYEPDALHRLKLKKGVLVMSVFTVVFLLLCFAIYSSLPPLAA